MTTTKRLTGRAAVTAWPERLAAMKAEPTDENLQRLCSLLDVVDRWIVQRWGTAGHGDRLVELALMRGEAREAKRVASTAQRTRTPAQTAALAKARASRDRRPTVPKPLLAQAGVLGTGDGPAA